MIEYFPVQLSINEFKISLQTEGYKFKVHVKGQYSFIKCYAPKLLYDMNTLWVLILLSEINAESTQSQVTYFKSTFPFTISHNLSLLSIATSLLVIEHKLEQAIMSTNFCKKECIDRFVFSVGIKETRINGHR